MYNSLQHRQTQSTNHSRTKSAFNNTIKNMFAKFPHQYDVLENHISTFPKGVIQVKTNKPDYHGNNVNKHKRAII